MKSTTQVEESVTNISLVRGSSLEVPEGMLHYFLFSCVPFVSCDLTKVEQIFFTVALKKFVGRIFMSMWHYGL